MPEIIATPILMVKNEKKYLLMMVSFGNDGSIYFNFPFSKGRTITHYSKNLYSKKNKYSRKGQFIELDEANDNPKVSFHPRDMIVHLNSSKPLWKSRDYELLNVGAVDGKVFVYLIQIILPISEDNYDEYYKTKHKERVEIDCDNYDHYKLSLEIIVHSSDIFPSDGCLPPSQSREFLYSCTLEKSKDYTYSLFVSKIKDELISTEDIILSINTKRIHLMYEIEKNGDK